MNINEINQTNYLVIILCVATLLVVFLFKKDLEPKQVYGIVIILTLIVLLTLISICSGKENFDNTRHCYNRNKEYLDYKDKIFDRVEDLAEIENSNRQDMVYDDEDQKIIEMGHLNLDYLANGETF